MFMVAKFSQGLKEVFYLFFPLEPSLIFTGYSIFCIFLMLFWTISAGRGRMGGVVDKLRFMDGRTDVVARMVLLVKHNNYGVNIVEKQV
jgi:hypothetical protein